MKKVLSLCMLVLMLFTCIVVPVTSADNAGEKELTVVFTHDLHSYIDIREYQTKEKTTQSGGFAKIKTILDDIKTQHQNTVVVDAGDFSMGILFQTVYTEKAKKETSKSKSLINKKTPLQTLEFENLCL